MLNEPASLANRYFLVVDDEEFVRILVARFLKRFGAAGVVEAADGREAIAAIEASDMTFDAVLTDVNMRPVNGIDLLRAIRTGEGGLKRNTPVLMLTAHAEAGLVAEALALDADAFVLKPVKREDLIERVLRIMEHSVPIQAASCYAAVGNDPGIDPAGAAAVSPKSKANDPLAVASAPPTKPLQVALEALLEPAFEAWTAGTPHKVAIDEVKPNSILAQDIFILDSPRLLLGAPAILTTAMLDRLKDLGRLHDSYAHLVVIEPAA
jgi:CheY-like chemotaxis protein